ILALDAGLYGCGDGVGVHGGLFLGVAVVAVGLFQFLALLFGFRAFVFIFSGLISAAFGFFRHFVLSSLAAQHLDNGVIVVAGQFAQLGFVETRLVLDVFRNFADYFFDIAIVSNATLC